ncbi:hypothetical protein RhiirA5_436051 [Rhizophagus irregularis]|uniref:Uncharacterized protein n=3 Tax=Rhizophagus irregularis TaxID=588596 RepID=A0A2I1FA55_9GLOM|nr:hypothetical protein GLOIN_2v1789929 [Rhizophagus irregularis DAOM 181602=DAOM 197198]EXX64073.1 hypothetical protein RirG_146240 [Rhizophagus irregularis DAOM 197198w]PKB95778.1 hypothetical protein RhiirA5_436051 [Rhizophagus irregularis]PKY31265.1 hypothetical protein RhiirB3_448789 [Rhizophagus irregularis]PKY32741.1 hypothetical protein RhiirB3_451146 [Rhizophagus irregularis]POG58765.1 hypothetical protein GLOIN_2v1789929 [Rhizophagus irregularis DAOM 181602=DAOM 197198]|eukprot:XP_025165631.1 hypothetical protein GLOIN_2v1789929 [Rhizophagus irregularis DAOM 181602=DAOM 197198]
MSSEVKIGSSVYRYCDGNTDLKVLSTGVGAKAAANATDGVKAKLEVGVDLVNCESGGFKSRIGLNADTGGSIGPNGIEAKVVGVGFKLGREMGLSTPFGEVSFNLF